MFSYGQVTVSESAAEIVAADSEHSTEVVITILNLYEDAIYFGDSDVTSSTGLFFAGPGGGTGWNFSFTTHLHPGQTLYAISNNSDGVLISYLATA